MLFESYYLNCLAHASYLIADGGEAAVVDPQRDVEQYLDFAREHGLDIRWVLETHLHADFVSGHVELAARTGATIVLGHRAGAEFPHRAVKDGDVIELGRVRIEVLETPGHTPESVCYLVTDMADPAAPPRLLTGDTLFVGDVGRPDLATSRGYTGEQMAGMLFDSLTRRILTLPDEVEVHPAHGAGSACGRNIGRERSTTIGDQRRHNPSLRAMSKDEFVRLVTTDLPPAPAYFGHDAETNRRGAPALAELPPPPPLSPDAVERLRDRGAVVLDVRESNAFLGGHVPGSLHVGLSGQFASWAGSLLPADAPIVLVTANEDEVAEARLRLARVGYEHVAGYLAGGVLGWAESGRPVRALAQATVDELAAGQAGAGRVIDVRRRGEYESGHVPGSLNAPLDDLAQSPALAALPPGEPVAVVCQSGYRSAIASSLIAARHPGRIVNVIGGTLAWQAAGHPVETASAGRPA